MFDVDTISRVAVGIRSWVHLRNKLDGLSIPNLAEEYLPPSSDRVTFNFLHLANTTHRPKHGHTKAKAINTASSSEKDFMVGGSRRLGSWPGERERKRGTPDEREPERTLGRVVYKLIL